MTSTSPLPRCCRWHLAGQAASRPCETSPAAKVALPAPVVPCFVVVVGGGARAGAATVVWAGRSSCFADTCCPRRRRPRSLERMSQLHLTISGFSCYYLLFCSRVWAVVFSRFCSRSWYCCCYSCAVVVSHLHCLLETPLNHRTPLLKNSHPRLHPLLVVAAVSFPCARYLVSQPVMTQVVSGPFPQFLCKWLEGSGWSLYMYVPQDM